MIRERIVSLCAGLLSTLLLSSLPSRAESTGNVGCLFNEQVCQEGELCFDDLVIGRCIPAASDDEELVRMGPLSGPPLDILAAEIKRVFSQGYTWEDDYSQCVFQTLLNHIHNREFYSTEECSHLAGKKEWARDNQDDTTFISDDTADDEDDNSFVPEEDDNSYIPEEGDNSYIPEEDDNSYNPEEEDNSLDDDDDTGIQYSSRLSHKTDLPSYGGEKTKFPSSSSSSSYYLPEIIPLDLAADNPHLDDLSLLLNDITLPRHQHLADEEFQDYDDQLMSQEDDQLMSQEDDQLMSYADDQLMSYADAHSPLAETYTGAEDISPLLLQSYLPHEHVYFLEEEDIGQEIPEIIPINWTVDEVPEDDHTYDKDDDFFGPAADTDLEENPLNNFREKRRSRDSLDELDNNDDDKDDEEEGTNESLSNFDFDYNDSSGREEGDNDDAIYYDQLPVETIFDRRERLDVKKPGPFFANSQNNFFLNKLLDMEDETDVPDEDIGQTEYEMPLTTQKKHKKSTPLGLGTVLGYEVAGTQDSYLVVNINGRFNTLGQANEVVGVLANLLQVPAQTFGEPKLWTSRLSIPVQSNPRQLNASSMAKVLGDKLDMVNELIDGKTGVQIESFSTSNHEDAVVSVFTGHSRLFLALFLLTAGLASVLVMGALILILKRRRGKKVETNKDEVEDKDEPVKEYKQLVRDWSRSSRASQGSGNGNGAGGSEDGAAKARTISEDGAKRQPLSGVAGKQQNSEGSRTSSTSSWQEDPGVSTMDISTGHMVLAYMEDHLSNKQRLEQEWVGLCAYEAEPAATTIAFKMENKKKNRYPDKLPYDHNRVLLNALVNGNNSDYINASTVTDHDPRNPAYIVTQGPMAHTIADFWQMVWEQGSVVIVMLSRSNESGYQLVHRYWPEEGSNQYHIYEVHLVSEHVWCEDYLVRSLYLKNTQTGETRTVTQFHFLSWADAQTPTNTKFLLEFRRKVNKSYRGRSCPIIVHCSDGVGRSGTYVLIDMVLNRMNKGSKEIDIAATLEHIRDQRSGMVQTRSQFEFCLTSVAEETHAILKSLAQ